MPQPGIATGDDPEGGRVALTTVPAHRTRAVCTVCPRWCRLAEGEVGFCGDRICREGQVVLAAFGLCSGLRRRPIEHVPLVRYLPGTRVLSVGTGQDLLGSPGAWRSPHPAPAPRHAASPAFVASAAASLGCRSVGFMENDPAPFHEYASAVAAAAREMGLHVVARTSGYVGEVPRTSLLTRLDAVCVELGGFDRAYYQHAFAARLQDVLDTCTVLRETPSVWLEIAFLLRPGLNERQVADASSWVAAHLGEETPFTIVAGAKRRGAVDTRLEKAVAVARANGLSQVQSVDRRVTA
jgi:pyruvate formate lyase activating enzyme